MNTLEHDYFRLITESNIEEHIHNFKAGLVSEARDKGIEPAAYLQEHKKDILRQYQKIDLGILCTLLDNGQSWRNVYENFTNSSIIMNELDSPEEIRSYTDEVLGMVQDEMYHRTRRDFEEASRAFANYTEALEAKYQDMDEELNDYRNGEIVINMLLKDDFSQDTIEKVLLSNNYSEEYVKGLMEKSMLIKRLYKDISAAPPMANAKNEFDIYRAVAKEYMAKLGIKTMSYNDDLAICQQLKSLKFPDNYLRRSFLRASPVAHEPGRNPESYVEAVLSGDSSHAEFKAGLNKSPVMDIEQVYKAALEIYDKYLKDKGINKDIEHSDERVYYDCLATRKLFNAHFTENEIYGALGYSPQSSNPAFPGYAQWLLDKTNKLLNRERELLNYKRLTIPAESYKDLLDKGFTPTEMVIGILQDRMELNPSLKQRLYLPFVDKDLAESALTMYPDFDHDALKGIINSFPRAIILSGTRLPEEKNYADNVIAEATKRIEAANNIRKAQEKLQESFKNQQDVQYQGVTGETSNMKMSIYHLGRTALAMMRSGSDEQLIRDMIAGNTPSDMPQNNLDDMAEKIIRQNKEVIRRVQAIDAYKEPTIAGAMPTPRDFYLSKMSKQHKIRKAFNASMDADIVKDMLALNYSRNDIKNTIQECSPIMCQPGRGNDYYDKYVRNTALQSYQTELTKLVNYYPEPRQQKEADCRKEYQYHLQKIKAAIALPFMIEMDGLIAATMLMQGFAGTEICDALNQMSPLKDTQKNYGTGVVKNAEKDIDEMEKPVQPAMIAEDISVETTIRETYIGEEKINSEVIGEEVKKRTRVLQPETHA